VQREVLLQRYLEKSIHAWVLNKQIISGDLMGGGERRRGKGGEGLVRLILSGRLLGVKERRLSRRRGRVI